MDLSSMNFSNFFWKPPELVVMTTSCGSEFHKVIKSCVKKYILSSTHQALIFWENILSIYFLHTVYHFINRYEALPLVKFSFFPKWKNPSNGSLLIICGFPFLHLVQLWYPFQDVASCSTVHNIENVVTSHHSLDLAESYSWYHQSTTFLLGISKICPQKCYGIQHEAHIYNTTGIMPAILFSLLFLIIPSIEFIFFTTAAFCWHFHPVQTTSACRQK